MEHRATYLSTLWLQGARKGQNWNSVLKTNSGLLRKRLVEAKPSGIIGVKYGQCGLFNGRKKELALPERDGNNRRWWTSTQGSDSRRISRVKRKSEWWLTRIITAAGG